MPFLNGSQFYKYPYMTPVLAPSIQAQVVYIIQKLTKIPVSKLTPSAHLYQELGLDALQVVEIIWSLEKRFHLEIPDAVPLHTVGDFIHFVANPST